MAFTGNNRPGTQAPVAFLDDARKRPRGRGRGRKRRHSDEEHALESSGEDCSRYALGLADSLLSADVDSAGASSPDEILARHEAPSETTSSAPAVEEPQPAALPDDILLALEVHHQRSEPREGRRAPRGSADLDAYQPQRQRPKATGARAHGRVFFARRRLVGAAGIAAVAVGVAIAVNANTGTSALKVADRPASAGDNAVVLTLGTIEIPRFGLLATNQHHGVKPGARRRPRPAVKRAATAHSESAPPVSAGPPASTSTPSSTGSTPSSTGGGGTYATTASYSSQPTSSSPPSTPSSSAQPAGPAGPGYVIGSNCNPKCR